MRILIYGRTGWIGGKLYESLSRDHEVIASKVRLEEYGLIGKELDLARPSHVLLCAGLTGRPNIDWCEDHQLETLRVNVLGTGILATECAQRGIHLTYMGTGCIYEYDQDHTWDGPGFTELDRPNFTGSFYSRTKVVTEQIMKTLPNVLTLRIRMPLSDDLHPRSFITKILGYEKVVNIPNSMTILHDLLPLVPDMMREHVTGLYNFVNPGLISHNQILDLYREYIDPDFHYQNFSLEEHNKVVKAPRSNNRLDTTKLEELFPGRVPDIQTGIRGLFERMARLNSSKNR